VCAPARTRGTIVNPTAVMLTACDLCNTYLANNANPSSKYVHFLYISSLGLSLSGIWRETFVSAFAFCIWRVARCKCF